MPAPRYLISYSFSINGRPGGTGQLNDYRPTMGGKPCTLTPDHVNHTTESVAAKIRRETGYQEVGVSITSIWRYETDAE